MIMLKHLKSLKNISEQFIYLFAQGKAPFPPLLYTGKMALSQKL